MEKQLIFGTAPNIVVNAQILSRLFFLILIFAKPLAAVPVLDRSYEGCGTGFTAFLGHQGQAFEVKIAGTLTAFDLYLARNSGQTNGTISWEMRRTLFSGYPDFTSRGLLASGLTPLSDLPRSPAFVHFSLTNAPLVKVGDGLAIVVQGTNYTAEWIGNTIGCGGDGFGYAFSLQTGSIYIFTGPAALGVQTYVEPYPPLPKPILFCPEARVEECGGLPTIFTSGVWDPSGYAVRVVWSLDGQPVHTNQLAARQENTNWISYIASLSLGDHLLQVSASNGKTDPVNCSVPVLVRDTTPPIITSLAANPKELWPPNGQMLNVNVQGTASDTCGPAECKIVSVEVIDPRTNTSQPADQNDWALVESSLQLRATRNTRGESKVYSVVVECSDASGNKIRGSTTVTVPHDRRQ
ncbi:MAG: hypothetical protein JWM16_2836 [Verrucomicrobiales bacterium]|nr:hypothetical protein [Verrucomicrobiales bacterium]